MDVIFCLSIKLNILLNVNVYGIFVGQLLIDRKIKYYKEYVNLGCRYVIYKYVNK